MGKSNIRFRDAKDLYFVDESEVLTVECSLAKGSIGVSLAIDEHSSLNLTIDLYDGLATIPVGDILRAADQRNRSNLCYITITATCDGASVTTIARCVFCRRFSDDESVIFSSWLCSCGSQKVTYRSAPEILPFLADPSAATQSALIRISFLDGTSSEYTFADLRNMAVDGLEVSPKAVAEFASGKGVNKEIVSYDLWIIRESSSGARTTGKPCSFEIVKDRIERVTYKFLNQKGAFEYIHASGELRRSIDARTKTFISPGSESELSNDSSVIMEQNAGHIGSLSEAAAWLDFLSSSRRYVVDKSMAEHLIVVEDNKSETLDFGVGEISFRWHYGDKSASRADSAIIPLESLRQRCESVINTPLNRVRIDVDYEPSYTNQRGVIWRIVDGGEFVSLNSDGILRVKEGAHGSRVTILAQSVHDGSITDLKSYTVSYNTQAPSYPMTIEANVESPVVDLIIDDSEVDYEDGILIREGQLVTLRVSKPGYNTQSRSFEFSATEKSQYFYLVRHFQADDYVSESTVKALISEAISSLDWFFDESYEKDGETKRRLKLNPRYQGLYTEGWIASGGISDTPGGGGASYLRDLLDVDLPAQIDSGQALVWDGDKWTTGTITPGTQVTEETVAGWGFTKNTGTVTQVKVGTTTYDPSNGVVSLPDYPTTLPASDVSAWAKKSSLAASDVPSLAISKITGLQSALNGKADVSALADYLSLTGGSMKNTNKVTNLNADLLDGHDSDYFATASGLATVNTGLATVNTGLAAANANISTLQGYFTDGSAKSALRLAGSETRTAWGRIYWSAGVPASISGDMTGVGRITMDVKQSASSSGNVIEVVNVGTESAPVYALHSTLPIYSDSWISAGGVSASGDEGSGVSWLRELRDVDDNLNPDSGDVLVWDGAKWTAREVELSGYVTTQELNTALAGYATTASLVNYATTQALADYLPLAGGTMSNTNVVTNLNADLLDGFDATHFATASDLVGANAAIEEAGANIITLQNYFTDGAANSALKLDTSRNIWGQNFDGTGDVDGILTLSYSSALRATGIEVTSSNGGEASIGFGSTGRTVFGRYPDRGFVWSSVSGELMTFLDNGNVGIGRPSPAYKLDVNGDIRSGGRVYIGSSGGYLEVVNVGTESGPEYALHSTLPIYSDSWVSSGGVFTGGSGGGGSSYLRDLLDVDVTPASLSEGNALMWNTLTQKWEARNVADYMSDYVTTQELNTALAGYATTASLANYATTQALADYLPLAGGTMSGSINMTTGTDTAAGAGLEFRNSDDVLKGRVASNDSGLMQLFATGSIVMRPGGDTTKGIVLSTTDITYNGVSLKQRFFYGTGTVSGTTVAVTSTGFTSADLKKGTVMVIQMGYKLDTNSNVTVNVNSTGAKSIYSPGGYKSWKTGENVILVYTSSGDWTILPTFEYIIQHISGSDGGSVVSGVSSVVGRDGDVTAVHIATALAEATRDSDPSSVITGGTTANRYYGVETGANGKLFVNVPWTSYTLPAATSGALGGIRIGYTLDSANKKYPVELDTNNRAYVKVPWTSGSGGSTVSVSQTLDSGTEIAKITVDGSTIKLYAPSSGGSYTLPAATSGALGGIRIGYTLDSANKKYPVKLDTNNRAYVEVPWQSGGGSYTLPQATQNALGGIKIGYQGVGKNYPVELDTNGMAFVNVPWQSGSGGSTVAVTQGTIKNATAGTLVGTLTVDGTNTPLYAPKVTINQVQPTGKQIATITVGSANPVSIFAPSGVGESGAVTVQQIATALTAAGYKLTDTVPDLSGYVTTQGLNNTLSGYVTTQGLNNTLSGYVTTQGLNNTLSGYATTASLGSYLPLSAGSGKALTNTLYSRAIQPTANGSYDLGTSKMRFNNAYVNRVYLADGIYVYYDSDNQCIRTNAPIVSDSYMTGGGVSTT